MTASWADALEKGAQRNNGTKTAEILREFLRDVRASHMTAPAGLEAKMMAKVRAAIQ